ncbi:MAG: hypothetical protein ABI120_00415 [Gemmatimonadaceae bacterium]
MNERRSAVFAIALACTMVVPALGAQPGTGPAMPLACRTNVLDSLDANFVPAGFGTLKEDDVAIKISLIGGLQVTATPLDERVIRLLAPDIYKSRCQIRASKQKTIDSIANRERLTKPSLWYVTFYAVEQGEVRFSPQEFIIGNVGRDFRPKGLIPLSSGFGDYRLKQFEVQTAIYVFDGQLNVNQPLTAQIQSARSNTDWQQVLRRIEQERALVRSRAASKSPAQ